MSLQCLQAKGFSAITDPVTWVKEHNPMITSLSVTAITFSDEVRSPLDLKSDRSSNLIIRKRDRHS